jgi:hypothetical protein
MTYMRNFLCANLALALLAASANAATVGFSPTGSGAFQQLDSVDISPGNLLVDADSLGDYSVGGVTQGYFQAVLTSFTGPGGTQTLLSSSTGSEFTVVLAYQQTFTAVVPLPNGILSTTTLAAGGDNYFALYYDTNAGTFANNLTGTGFTNGVLVLEGTISSLNSQVTLYTQGDPAVGTSPQLFDQNGVDDYAGQQTLPASGSFSLAATLSYVNPLFFSSLTAGTTISFAVASGEIELGFEDVNPSGSFVTTVNGSSTTTPTLGALNGTGIDRQFQVDPTATFQVAAIVPEPASMLIWGGIASALGLGGMIRRRKK